MTKLSLEDFRAIVQHASAEQRRKIIYDCHLQTEEIVTLLNSFPPLAEQAIDHPNPFVRASVALVGTAEHRGILTDDPD